MAAVDTNPQTIPGVRSPSLTDHARSYGRRLRGGDLGSLPAIIGLVVLCVIFTIADPVFLTARNFANLFTQGSAVTIIAMGLIFVLLLGEIDLSAGYTSGVCAAVMALVLARYDFPWYAAILVARMRCGERISKLTEDELREGIDWAKRQMWLEEDLRKLFEQGQVFLSML